MLFTALACLIRSFEHVGSGVPVRLCIAYPGFAFRAHVLRGLVQLEPRLRSLVQLVELWAEARGLSNPAAGTFNSWALAQLVSMHLQTITPLPIKEGGQALAYRMMYKASATNA